MSATTDSAAPNGEAAFNTLYDNVVVPVFFQKLANDGLRPANRDEAAQLLKIGRQLLAAEQIEHTKQAAASGSLLSYAAAHLDQVLGVEPAVTSAREENFCKQAALAFAAQADVLQAASVLNQINAAG